MLKSNDRTIPNFFKEFVFNPISWLGALIAFCIHRGTKNEYLAMAALLFSCPVFIGMDRIHRAIREIN
jgi:hypothetical protein